MHNKIKVIKRQAYGFRDDEYFILKIKGAFPGRLQPHPR
jgi:transposase